MVKVKAKEVLFDGMQRRDEHEVFYVADMSKVSERSMEVIDDHIPEKEAEEVSYEEEKNGRKKGPSKLIPDSMRDRKQSD